MLHTMCSQPELRASLRRRAAHYMPLEADQNLLIDRTIAAVCDDPELVEGDRIQEALFKVMHKMARPEVSYIDPSVDRDLATA